MDFTYPERFENIGTLPRRAYYVPFRDRTECERAVARTDSSRLALLNGNWKVSVSPTLVDCVGETPDKTVRVPGCLQFDKLAPMQYTNVRYPFVFRPPYVPRNNLTFHYSRRLTVKKDGEQKVLVFEGVDSCAYVYVNGEEAGFFQVSHSMHELDVTDLVVDGENVLDVIVLRWCAGSYFEDQDKLRFSGIFRDVYLLSRPVGAVEDYVTSAVADEKGGGALTFSLIRGGDCTVTFEGQSKQCAVGETVKFVSETVLPWSAEAPMLYNVDIETDGEFIRERVGFKRIEIKNGVFYFNGAPIKLCGVNRHDFHPDKGATVSREDMLRDLTLMKQLNVNAIRTSHYPSAPEFYQLCDELGFYVIDEADIETHGCVTSRGGYDPKLWGILSDDPRYESAIVGRVMDCYERDKNRACVTMWSLGNESGMGRNFVAAARELKKHTDVPIHYESAIHCDGLEGGMDNYYQMPMDVASRMYPPIEWMRDEFLQDERDAARPLVLCEFVHAMGNGPGGFMDYWNLIESNDRFMGGCVWEWKDHGVRADEGFRYGGDFGEVLHDGNFCIDGIVLPDTKVKRNSVEMREVYAPIAVSYLGGGEFELFNKRFFENFEGGVRVRFEGATGTIKEVDTQILVAPRGKLRLETDLPKTEGFLSAVFEFYGVPYTGGASTLLSVKGITLREAAKPVFEPSDECNVVSDADVVTISNDCLTVTVDRTDASVAVSKDGKPCLLEPMRVVSYRAPTDNDMYIKQQWKAMFYHLAYPIVTKIDFDRKAVTVKGVVAYDSFAPILAFQMVLSLSGDSLLTKFEYAVADDVTVVPPRVGLGFAMRAGKDTEWQYLGYGVCDERGKSEGGLVGGDAYVDKQAGAIKQLHTLGADAIETLAREQIKPQESSSHSGTVFAGCDALQIDADAAFSFSVSPYDEATLEKTAHADELFASDKHEIRLDVQMCGIGTNSCGPKLSDCYQIAREGKRTFRLTFNRVK